MTDASLLTNPKLLLLWSASLEYEALTFDEWLARYQAEGKDHDPTYGSCADAAGFSVRVAERTLAVAR